MAIRKKGLQSTGARPSAVAAILVATQGLDGK
jgi:hypothetical protein